MSVARGERIDRRIGLRATPVENPVPSHVPSARRPIKRALREMVRGMEPDHDGSVGKDDAKVMRVQHNSPFDEVCGRFEGSSKVPMRFA